MTQLPHFGVLAIDGGGLRIAPTKPCFPPPPAAPQAGPGRRGTRGDGVRGLPGAADEPIRGLSKPRCPTQARPGESWRWLGRQSNGEPFSGDATAQKASSKAFPSFGRASPIGDGMPPKRDTRGGSKTLSISEGVGSSCSDRSLGAGVVEFGGENSMEVEAPDEGVHEATVEGVRGSGSLSAKRSLTTPLPPLLRPVRECPQSGVVSSSKCPTLPRFTGEKAAIMHWPVTQPPPCAPEEIGNERKPCGLLLQLWSGVPLASYSWRRRRQSDSARSNCRFETRDLGSGVDGIDESRRFIPTSWA